MIAPLHALYLRTDQHDAESIQLTLIDLHLDEVWLRLSSPSEIVWGGSPVYQLELFHLQDGLPIVPESLGPMLSQKDKVALRLSADASRSSIAFELFRDGKSAAGWAGDVECFGDEEHRPKKLRSAKELAQSREGFLEHFEAVTGLRFAALMDAETISERTAEVALEGTLAMVRNRFVRLVKGMGRWPELFRFHDRHEDEEREEPADPAEGEGPDERSDLEREHVALCAFDARHAERIWRARPASQVYQFLRRVEPLRGAVLGPLSHVLPEALAVVEGHPPEQPLASTETPDLTLYEVLALASGLVYMVGDRIRYLDERFFPLLCLTRSAPSRSILADAIEEIRELDIVSAMTEVLPYSVPEGEMMEAFADEELAPLATWAVEGDSYEGCLFLLDPTRLRQIVEDFDIDELKGRVDAFRKLWFELSGAESFEAWLEARNERDDAELSRFEDTFVELQHTLRLAEGNNLSLALVFYSE
jgi:hypothetical protein